MSLPLRVTTGMKKMKTTMSIPPVVIAFPLDDAGPNRILIENFLQAATTDTQLSILKELLNEVDSNVIKLLANVFFQSAAKHPVKSVLTRYVTQSLDIKKPFEEELTAIIASHMKNKWNRYSSFTPSPCDFYKETITKLAMCIENFPSGVAAVEAVENDLIIFYLKTCLGDCVEALRSTENQSPMEINEVYSLVHLATRLLLHILNSTKSKLSCPDYYNKIYKVELDSLCSILNNLIDDGNTPMDAKTVCAIASLTARFLQFYCTNDEMSTWLFVMQNLPEEPEVQAQLAWCSALLAVVPWPMLAAMRRSVRWNIPQPGQLPLASILTKLLNITESSLSDGILVLGVWRALRLVSGALRAPACPCACAYAGRDGMLAEYECARPWSMPCELAAASVARILPAVWAHLVHHLDSVRHLAAQVLADLVLCAATLEKAHHTCLPYVHGGSGVLLTSLLGSLSELGDSHRGFYAGVRGAVAGLGAARVLRDVVQLPRLLSALAQPHLTATVKCTLEEVLCDYARSLSTAALADQWALPLLRWVETQQPPPPPHVLSALEGLLAHAVALHGNPLVTHIVEYAEVACGRAYDGGVASSASVMFVLRVARAGLVDAPRWHALVSQHVLRDALHHADDETRLAALALVTDGKGAPARTCLAPALHYLRYDLDAQDKHHQQQALALCKKFIKRVESGIQSAMRASDHETALEYRQWMDELRSLCYRSLRPGANCSRRAAALALLVATHPLDTTHYHSSWKAEWVERLVAMLEDSFKTNKEAALHVLLHCPLDLLKSVCAASELTAEAVWTQAESLQPSESASAAYKLELLWRRLPDTLLDERHASRSGGPEAAGMAACRRLLISATPRGFYDAVHAPRNGPFYGALHCLRHLLELLDWKAISKDVGAMILVTDVVHRCSSLMCEAGNVINTAAPEGGLPEYCQLTHIGNDAGVVLEDGRPVTAQMVLLCAWRTVMEAVGVMGCVGERLALSQATAQNTGQSIILQNTVKEQIRSLLIVARHRGVLEQTYLAYERVLYRAWRIKYDGKSGFIQSHYLQQKLVSEVLQWLETDSWTQPADRRSAGLPYLVQAVVGTQPEPWSSQSALPRVMAALLRRASQPGALTVADRAHFYNILRALYRHTALDAAVQPYVGEGLAVAMRGFAGPTWTERNACTLLLSALLQRVFGVTRARADPAARNRMTGRVFYLRYPHLYDLMQNQLKEVSTRSEALLLCPSLYPVLVLLARLYPSSLEGSESNLKLVSFVPLVVACAASRVEHTRRLAAKAAVSLIPPHRYVEHLQYLLGLLDERLQRNACHGLLLQILALLENKPAGVECGALSGGGGGGDVERTLWLVRMRVPCYPVLTVYHAVLAHLADETRFPGVLSAETLASVETHLQSVLAERVDATAVTAGLAVCAAGALRLLVALAWRRGASSEAADHLLRALHHQRYEVVETALDCLLALHNRECSEEISPWLVDEGLLASLPSTRLLASLKSALDGSPQTRLRDKILEVCVLTGDALVLASHMVDVHLELRPDEGSIVFQLLCMLSPYTGEGAGGRRSRMGRYLYLQTLEATFAPALVPAHLVLESALQLVTKLLQTESAECPIFWLESVSWNVWLHASPRFTAAERAVVAAFLRRSGNMLLALSLTRGSHNTAFVECGVWCACALLLQAEEPDTRVAAERALRTMLPLSHQYDSAVVPSLARARLLDAVEAAGVSSPVKGAGAGAATLLTALALQHLGEPEDPAGTPSTTNQHETSHNDWRVFSPSERNNVYFEEEILSGECGARFARLHAQHVASDVQSQRGVGDGDVHSHRGELLSWLHAQLAVNTKHVLEAFCKNNYYHFKQLCDNQGYTAKGVHPKVRIFLQELLKQ